ncbi:MAG: tRNA (adenosine(37)-N6)-threonylcarbamoyltransferase complex ATPase subunit type 1 TsaE [Bacteroidota bacterium]
MASESHHKTIDAKETFQLGQTLSYRLRPGDVVALYGELGAGKTEFIKGICVGLRVRGHIASPSFILINEYPFQYSGKDSTVYHIDLYRLNSTSELFRLGLDEYLSGNGICLIEWAERAKAVLPAKRYDVSLQLGTEENTRIITIAEVSEVSA